MSGSTVAIERRGPVGILWLDRPEAMNAFGPRFWVEFPEAVGRLGEDEAIRALVVAARGRAFTVGLDLEAFAGPLATGRLEEDAEPPASGVLHRRNTYRMIKTMQHTFTALADCPKPVIAAVHGWCIGAGVDLVTACDLRYAARNAVFSVRETKLGIVADVGTLQRLPEIVDPGTVAELVYTGKNFSAAEALEMRLVTRVEEDPEAVLDAAVATAEQIAANPPLAVQGAKAVLQAATRRRIADQLDYVALWNAAFLHSDDLSEAMAAFAEKREPRFEGR